MRKILLFIFASFISSFAFAQHVEYYPNSQRYYLEPYNKPEMNWSDSCNDAYPFSYLSVELWPVHNENNRYYLFDKLANKCHVSNMNGRAIYGVVVICNILQFIGQYDWNHLSMYPTYPEFTHGGLYYPLSFDSVSKQSL